MSDISLKPVLAVTPGSLLGSQILGSQSSLATEELASGAQGMELSKQFMLGKGKESMES